MTPLGMRPVVAGLLAGGLVGSLLAAPVIHDKVQQRSHDVEEGTSAMGTSLPRRLAGFGANFVVPGVLLAIASRTGINPAVRGVLMTSAAAVPGAYWGARQLADV